MTLGTSFEAKVRAAFIAALLVVAALTATTWKIAADATEAAGDVTRAHEVLNKLARARGDTLQIELNTQSFRISGETQQLVERDLAMASREAELSQLQSLTTKNPEQQRRWAALREVVNRRIAVSKEIERLRKAQQLDAANAFVASAPLRETRKLTHQLLRQMEDEESRLLNVRNVELLSTRRLLTTAGLAVALLLAAVLAATYVLIRRQLRETTVTQRALADSEEGLATTLRSIGDAVLATDTQGRITRMNPVAERLCGWPLAEAQGRPIDEVFRIVNERTRAPGVVPVAHVLETGEIKALSNHLSLIARDGSECPIADSAAPIRDASGQMRGVVLVFRDVRLERQAQRTANEQNDLLELRVLERTAQLRDSEDHLRNVISHVPAMIAYVDAQQRYVYVNEQYRARFAPERGDIAGCTVREIMGEARYAVTGPMIDQVLQGQSQSYDWQPFPGFWKAVSYVPKLDADGQVIGYYVLGADITERKLAEERILTLNTQLSQRVRELEHVTRALRTLSAGNRTMLRATDEADLLSSMCDAILAAGSYAMAMVWYRNNDEARTLQPMAQNGFRQGLAGLLALNTTWADNERGQGAVARAIRTGQTRMVRDLQSDPGYAPWHSSWRGNASAVACPLRVGGEVIGALAIYAAEPDAFDADEVTLLTESADDLAFGIATLRARAEQQQIQAAMYRLTRFDALTGLPNETQFTEFLAAAIADGQRLQQPFAVLQTNIDRLSEINDALGFSHGDQLLLEFGNRLRHAAPAAALVARLRGDEFAILLPDSDRSAASAMVQRLEAVLALPFPVADITLDMSARTGLVLFPEHGSTPHDLFRHMDIAMHQSLKKGVRHAIFDPLLSQAQPSHLNMAGELRRAIEGDGLRLYLQPKIEFASGRLCGAEALVRWQHAERGLLPPGEFIGLAEHTGLIRPLTEWVIASVLRLNREWEGLGCALPIAVNLSARNLRDEELLEKIRSLQTAWGTAVGLLELELTETSVMDDAAFALRVLHSLRDEGIPLYIDDFGTGYSSLAYLQKLPVGYIKIDQSFVRDMSTNKDSAVIVRSTIDLAHDLGRKTVAEGVETQGDWDQLAAMGCDIAQGYFIARPMPAEAFQAWVAQYRPPVTTSA